MYPLPMPTYICVHTDLPHVPTSYACIYMCTYRSAPCTHFLCLHIYVYIQICPMYPYPMLTYVCRYAQCTNFLSILCIHPGITVTSSQKRTYYYNDSSTLPLLACRSDPDHEGGSVWYEWYINGSRSDTHNSSVEATTGVQTYVCYTHHENTSLSITYRVLPYGESYCTHGYFLC